MCDELKEHHPDGAFALVADPNVKREALIIGMLVLRPFRQQWLKPILDSSITSKLNPGSFYGIEDDWAYNFAGLDGGWLISNGSVVDGYRYAFI